MGYDVSYHPISPEEMDKLYFSQLKLLKETGKSNISEIVKERDFKGKEEYEDVIEEKYINVMDAAIKADTNEPFEKEHVFYLAVVQGLFHPYFYTRGTGFSILIEDIPSMKKYLTSWQDIKPMEIVNEVTDGIVENYSGGCYIGYDNVVKLLDDYENDKEIKNCIDEYYEQNSVTFIKALNYAKEHKVGLVEATEVIEPNPLDLKNTTTYSNLLNCDIDGALIYEETAFNQFANALKKEKELGLEKNEEKEENEKKDNSFVKGLKNLFGKHWLKTIFLIIIWIAP